MKKRRLVDSSKLIEAVESGQLDRELISKFGLETVRKQNPRTSKTEKERVVSRRRGASSSKIKNEIKINKRGSLIVPRETVEKLGFELEDIFLVRKIRSGISLKKA
ncbi:MAG: hypothetical protein V3V52_11355 [Candidatus Adiutricales bacterium]